MTLCSLLTIPNYKSPKLGLVPVLEHFEQSESEEQETNEQHHNFVPLKDPRT